VGAGSCISILESKGVSLRLSDHLHLQFLWLTLLESRLLLGANLTFEGKARCQALSRAYLCSRSCSDFPLRNSRQRHTEQVAKYQQDTQLRQSACLAACLPLGGQGCTRPQHTQSCLLDTGVCLRLPYDDFFQLGTDMRCHDTSQNVQNLCTCIWASTPVCCSHIAAILPESFKTATE